MKPKLYEEFGIGDKPGAILLKGDGPDPLLDMTRPVEIELAKLNDRHFATRGKAWARTAAFLRKAAAEAEARAAEIWPRALPALRVYVVEGASGRRTWIAARSLPEAVGLVDLHETERVACYLATDTECSSAALNLGDPLSTMLHESPHARVLGSTEAP